MHHRISNQDYSFSIVAKPNMQDTIFAITGYNPDERPKPMIMHRAARKDGIFNF